MKLRNLTKISSVEYNTCNGWGFNGVYGTKSKYSNGLIQICGKLNYRHLPSINFNEFRVIDNTIGVWERAIGNSDLLTQDVECSVYVIDNNFAETNVLPYYCVGTCEQDVLNYYQDGKHNLTIDDVKVFIKY